MVLGGRSYATCILGVSRTTIRIHSSSNIAAENRPEQKANSIMGSLFLFNQLVRILQIFYVSL